LQEDWHFIIRFMYLKCHVDPSSALVPSLNHFELAGCAAAAAAAATGNCETGWFLIFWGIIILFAYVGSPLSTTVSSAGILCSRRRLDVSMAGRWESSCRCCAAGMALSGDLSFVRSLISLTSPASCSLDSLVVPLSRLLVVPMMHTGVMDARRLSKPSRAPRGSRFRAATSPCRPTHLPCSRASECRA
jgi:hypothetical protein